MNFFIPWNTKYLKNVRPPRIEPIQFHCMDKKNLETFCIISFFVLHRRKSYRFGMTQGWLNDSLFILGELSV